MALLIPFRVTRDQTKTKNKYSMKTSNDFKSDVLNNYKRNPHLYVETTLGDIKGGIALPNSGRIKPITAKEAKDKGYDMASHKRAVEEFKSWLEAAFIDSDIEKAQARLEALLVKAAAQKASLSIVEAA